MGAGTSGSETGPDGVGAGSGEAGAGPAPGLAGAGPGSWGAPLDTGAGAGATGVAVAGLLLAAVSPGTYPNRRHLRILREEGGARWCILARSSRVSKQRVERPLVESRIDTDRFKGCGTSQAGSARAIARDRLGSPDTARLSRAYRPARAPGAMGNWVRSNDQIRARSESLNPNEELRCAICRQSDG